MIARAPGKLMLSGAYAVLEGAPTVVVAVDRYARADATSRGPARSAEAKAAYGSESAPTVDVGEMYSGGQKLGLGSSAAALVASLAADRAVRGEDVESRAVRDALFRDARDAHHAAQAGGSGADVAASVHGGAVRYRIEPLASAAAGAAGARAASRVVELAPVAMPATLVLAPYWTGTSARTSDLVGRVTALATRDRSLHERLLSALKEVAEEAARTFSRGDGPGFVEASRAAHRGLAALGRAIDAPIVPPAVSELAALAEKEGAAFVVSGAGGGDIALLVRASTPGDLLASLPGGDAASAAASDFSRAAERFGLTPLPLAFASRGVHTVRASMPPFAAPASSAPSSSF